MARDRGSPYSATPSRIPYYLRMHTAAYEALGMGEWSYEAIDVPPGELAEFVAELSDTDFAA